MNTQYYAKMALALFLGAVVGAFLALRFAPHFWWAGIIIGGLIGYVGCEPGEVGSTFIKVCTQLREEKKDLLTTVLAVVFVLLCAGGLALMLFSVFMRPISRPAVRWSAV